MARTVTPASPALPTTRRGFLATAGAAAVLASLPSTGRAADPTLRSTLGRHRRRTVHALLEADLPVGTPAARLDAGLAAVEHRYARASTAGRRELRRLVDALDHSPDGDRSFAELGRDERRELLLDLDAEHDPDVLDHRTARKVLDALPRLPGVAAPDGRPVADFAALPAGSPAPASPWTARRADPRTALRADVRTVLLLVRAGLESLDHLDEF